MPDETPPERAKRLREELAYIVDQIQEESRYTMAQQTTQRYKRLIKRKRYVETQLDKLS